MAYGETCFLRSTDTANWAGAEDKCKAAGGTKEAHLASCLTPAEMDFLSKKWPDKTDYFLGFYDKCAQLNP